MKRKCESNFKQEFEEFFTALKTQKGCFLESSAGEIFQPVFAQLRLQHIATSIKSVKALMSENVIPQSECSGNSIAVDSVCTDKDNFSYSNHVDVQDVGNSAGDGKSIRTGVSLTDNTLYS